MCHEYQVGRSVESKILHSLLRTRLRRPDPLYVDKETRPLRGLLVWFRALVPDLLL